MCPKSNGENSGKCFEVAVIADQFPIHGRTAFDGDFGQFAVRSSAFV